MENYIQSCIKLCGNVWCINQAARPLLLLNSQMSEYRLTAPHPKHLRIDLLSMRPVST